MELFVAPRTYVSVAVLHEYNYIFQRVAIADHTACHILKLPSRLYLQWVCWPVRGMDIVDDLDVYSLRAELCPKPAAEHYEWAHVRAHTAVHKLRNNAVSGAETCYQTGEIQTHL